MRAFLIPATMALALAAPAAAQTVADDEQAILALEQRWNELIVARDVAGVVDLYAEDGIILPPNSAAAQGPAPLTEVWKGLFAAPGLQLVISPVEAHVAASRDLAYDRGDYTLTTTTGENGAPVVDHGKYVVVWKKVGDDWKVATDIFNSNGTAP